MKEMVLKTSTGNRQADEILCGTISLLELVFAGRVNSYYLFGSYADESSRATSDIDLCLVLNDRFTIEEHEKFQHIKWVCAQLSPIMIDMIALDEQLLLQEGHFRIKSASRLLWGEDLRTSMPEQSFDQYLHTYTQAPITYMTQVLRHAESLTFPLSYPDSTGAFYGYDQPYLPPKGEAKHNIKGLVSSVCWAASILVAWHAGKTVASKSESVKRYRDEVHDEWTPFLEATYELGSRQWNYLIPQSQEDRLRLRDLCARTLAFENFYLSRYRSYLLAELQKDDESKLFAVQQLRAVLFLDEESRMALRTVECGNNDVLRKEAKKTQHALPTEHRNFSASSCACKESLGNTFSLGSSMCWQATAIDLSAASSGRTNKTPEQLHQGMTRRRLNWYDEIIAAPTSRSKEDLACLSSRKPFTMRSMAR